MNSYLPAKIDERRAETLPQNEPKTVEVLTAPQWLRPQSILFTQCTQEDFLHLLRLGEMSPTLVHVGRNEALRLIGPAGSLVTFLTLAHNSEPQVMAIVHIADKHDPVRDRAHLAKFGTHCTDPQGAALIGGIEELSLTRPNTHRIESSDLNDCHSTNLVPLLKELLEGRDLAGVRIGVVGVWTDVKVEMLIADLITELSADQVATCSALTASADVARHHNGLRKLEDVFGVKVFHSPMSLLKWLDPNCKFDIPVLSELNFHFSDTSRCPGNFSKSMLVERDCLIKESLELLGKDLQFTLRPLGGGFSGSQVFIAKGGEHDIIVKVGERNEVAHERFANERMARVTRGHAPLILGYREGPRLAVLLQELAQPKDGETEGPYTFQELAAGNGSEIITELLVETLSKTFRNGFAGTLLSASLGTRDLFRIYGYTNSCGEAQFVDGIKTAARKIYAKNGFASAEDLFKHLGLDGDICSPHEFYSKWLPGKSMIRDTYPTQVHGDLNLVNILLSRNILTKTLENLWIIDFARLSELPALTDFAKIENDLSFIILPLKTTDDFKRALKIQEFRLKSPTLDLTGIDELATTAEEKRYVTLLKQLRQIAAKVDDRDAEAMEGYRVALLRYAAHTLIFTEPNSLQLTLALCACGRLAGQIKRDNTFESQLLNPVEQTTELSQNAEEQAKLIIAQITTRARMASMLGQQHAVIMSVPFNNIENLLDGKITGDMQAERLSGAAKLVWEHCVAASVKYDKHLQPSLDFWASQIVDSAGYNIVIHFNTSSKVPPAPLESLGDAAIAQLPVRSELESSVGRKFTTVLSFRDGDDNFINKDSSTYPQGAEVYRPGNVHPHMLTGPAKQVWEFLNANERHPAIEYWYTFSSDGTPISGFDILASC